MKRMAVSSGYLKDYLTNDTGLPLEGFKTDTMEGVMMKRHLHLLCATLCLALCIALPGWAAYSPDHDLSPGVMSAWANEARCPAAFVLDGRLDTYWLTNGTNSAPALTINLGSMDFATPPLAPVTISAIRVMPREGATQPIKFYRIFVSADSTNGLDGDWTLVADGRWSYDGKRPQAELEKRVWFRPVDAKYVRLETQMQGGNCYSASEVRVEKYSNVPAVCPKIVPPAPAAVIAPPPADVEAQARSFQERNTPEQVMRLADEFFAQIDLTRPELREVNALYRAGKYDDALRAYRAFFFGQMRQCITLWPLFSAFEFPNPGYVQNTLYPDALMYGVAVVGKERTAIGEPGRINWAFDPQMRDIDTFYPLFDAYLETGNAAYLDRWCAYVDDWTLNYRDMRSALDLGNNCNPGGVRVVAYLFRYFSWLARVMPEDADGISETTLARVLMKTVQEYAPVSVLYARSDPQNWQMDVAQYLAAGGILLDRVHFKVGQFYLHEGIRALAAYHTHCFYLDGTELQRDVWYNGMWLGNGAMPIYRLLKATHPELLTPEWDGWFRDSFKARANYLVRIYDPSARLPLILRCDNRIGNLSGMLDSLPDLRQDPNIPVIVYVLAANAQKKEPAALPSFTSDAFPYAGYYLIRQGWRLSDQQGTFFCAGRNSDGFRMHASNAFALHAFGEDLIPGGERGPYQQIPTPLTVDGQEQQRGYQTVGFGHRWMWERISDRPNPFRWHSSPRYDVVEGGYDGPYGSSFWTWNALSAANVAKTMISGVTHQRWVYFLRRHGFWIVTDRVTGRDPHTYTQSWMFPAKSEPVEVDKEQQVIGAQVGQAAVSLYQFASQPLSYAMAPFNPFMRANVSFRATGAAAVVTGIYPRPADQPAWREIKALPTDQAACGFDAVTPDGARVRYLAAVEGSQALAIDTLAITGESLLLVNEPDGTVSGMVLGCKTFAIDGKAQPLGTPDAEFTLARNRLTAVIPIYRPIEPVVISPDVEVFTDRQAVTLSCATPGVTIYYTLDGSDPTPASPRYTRPMVLTASTTVKARAFRNGVTQVPDIMSGTLASSTTRADFTKETLLAADAVPDLKDGMGYQYFEGYWKDLFTRLDALTPMKRGEVANLFDITPRQSEGPFAFRYIGYLRVPADGVYSLYFPDEFCRLNVIAGYEMRVSIDGRPCLPKARRHAHGIASMALAKGLHRFTVDYMDLRGQNAQVKVGTKDFNTLKFDRTGTVTGKARMNFPELSPDVNLVWDGVAPVLEISGPGVSKCPIPREWLWHSAAAR